SKCSQVVSQNMTNTLGTGGLLSIKNNTTTFFRLSQSTGMVNILKNLTLNPVQGSQVGILYMGSSRFMHNFAPSGADGNNTFLGINAGNFTMSGTLVNSSFNT